MGKVMNYLDFKSLCFGHLKEFDAFGNYTLFFFLDKLKPRSCLFLILLRFSVTRI